MHSYGMAESQVHVWVFKNWHLFQSCSIGTATCSVGVSRPLHSCQHLAWPGFLTSAVLGKGSRGFDLLLPRSYLICDIFLLKCLFRCSAYLKKCYFLSFEFSEFLIQEHKDISPDMRTLVPGQVSVLHIFFCRLCSYFQDIYQCLLKRQHFIIWENIIYHFPPWSLLLGSYLKKSLACPRLPRFCSVLSS